MKKVLFVATVVRLHINMFHKPYIRWFHEQGWQVDVAANNDYENKEECIIPYCDHFYCLPFERSPMKAGNLEAYRQLKKLLDSEKYDIVHCHTPMGSVIARLAASSARKHGTKVIYTAHGFHFYKGAPLFNWLTYFEVEKALARYTDIMIVINEEDYRRARLFRLKKNGALYKIPGVGLDTGRFHPLSEEERKAGRKRLGIRDEDFFLVSVGELNEKVLLTYYISGLPFDCIQAAATWLFLWFGAEPMLEKLDRIKVKYGIVE